MGFDHLCGEGELCLVEVHAMCAVLTPCLFIHSINALGAGSSGDSFTLTYSILAPLLSFSSGKYLSVGYGFSYLQRTCRALIHPTAESSTVFKG